MLTVWHNIVVIFQLTSYPLPTLFPFLPSLSCNWHTVSHTYLKHTIWYVLTCTYQRNHTTFKMRNISITCCRESCLVSLCILSFPCFLSLKMHLPFLEFYTNGILQASFIYLVSFTQLNYFEVHHEYQVGQLCCWVVVCCKHSASIYLFIKIRVVSSWELFINRAAMNTCIKVFDRVLSFCLVNK